MRKLHLAVLGLLIATTAGAACSLSGSGSYSTDTGGGAAGDRGQKYGDWSYPGSGAPGGDANTGSSSSSTGGSLNIGTGGAGGGSIEGPTGSSSSGLPLPLDCHYDTTPVKLTIPASRLLSSPAMARALTSTYGKIPDPNVVHPAEFLNYYPIEYDAPAPGQLGLSVGLGQILDTNNLVLQIGVQAPPLDTRPRLSLAIVVDSSLSMAGTSMTRAREAAKALVQGLALGDAFMITTSLRATKPQATSIAGQADLDKAAALAGQVDVDGGEDLGGALDDAYLAVGDAVNAGGVARVVLITDGAAQPTAIDLGIVAGNREAQIPLIGVGVGDADHYDPKFLDVATSVGGGAEVFLDDKPMEADSILHKRFDELMFSAADDVEVTVSLPSVLRLQSVQHVDQGGSGSGLALIGVGPGHALVFRQNLETCATALSQLDAFKISVSARFLRPGEATYTDLSPVGGAVVDLLNANVAQVAKGSAIAAYADALAGLRPALFTYASTLTDAALKYDSTDPELTEIRDLITKNQTILKSAPAN
jgi:hypothetical protein